MVSFGPAAIMFWFSIHPFVSFLRRVGAKTTLVIHFAGLVVVAGVLIAYRDVLMRGDLGTSYVFTGLAVVLLIVSGVMRYYQNQVLPNTTLLGIPELDPTGHESRLWSRASMRVSGTLATFSWGLRFSRTLCSPITSRATVRSDSPSLACAWSLRSKSVSSSHGSATTIGGICRRPRVSFRDEQTRVRRPFRACVGPDYLRAHPHGPRLGGRASTTVRSCGD